MDGSAFLTIKKQIFLTVYIKNSIVKLFSLVKHENTTILSYNFGKYSSETHVFIRYILKFKAFSTDSTISQKSKLFSKRVQDKNSRAVESP